MQVTLIYFNQYRNFAVLFRLARQDIKKPASLALTGEP